MTNMIRSIVSIDDEKVKQLTKQIVEEISIVNPEMYYNTRETFETVWNRTVNRILYEVNDYIREIVVEEFIKTRRSTQAK